MEGECGGLIVDAHDESRFAEARFAPQLTCRMRVAEDLAACVALLHYVYVTDEYPATWPDDPVAWVNPKSTVAAWVALRGSCIVGHVAIGRVDETAQAYYSIAKGRPAAQLAEIKRLFSVEFARAQKLDPVLETMAEDERAIRFYERPGAGIASAARSPSG